ncbi:MAG: eukaryotic-like serine/threonine-protein kinase [Blastocatellia bacterium]|jgi:serine/threonine-protein kinase|nr:eukaryotic-like serine/threonine-protein kinase [Blastocatellia bacterium]
MKYCSTCTEKFDDSLSFCPTDGEVLEEDPAALIGKVLDGQYQIESLLGKGGMGAVYRARHILLGDRVAIKLLPPEMRSNTEWLRRFQREGQAARRFRHHNAVTVYDLRTSADGTIYLVMEYVEGHTLDAELRKRGKFSPADAVAVLDPIMGVLTAAHAMGVVHRDLKPENIMIGKAGTSGEPVVKLLDLGIAKLREVAGAEKTGSTNLTIAGQMLGTPYYMSPEQWGELPEDGNSEIDGRADIYSLGVVFYEVITGQRPFNGVTLSELRRQHISFTPPPLRELDAGVPEAFSRAIARAIAKDRSQRQATADELETELRSALRAEGIASTLFVPGVPSASDAIGSGSPRGPLTAAERTAATMVGESIPTGVGDSAAPQNVAPPANIPSQAATMPTVIAAPKQVEPAGAGVVQPTMMVSSQLGGVAARSSAQATAQPGGRSALPFVAVGIVVLLLVVGAGGYAVIHFMGASANNNTARADSANSNKGASGSDLAAGAHEVGRYWVEVNTPDKSEAVLAGESLSMKSLQQFKFHFSPSENGYLYIIGPGQKNAPTTFLTTKPVSGVKIAGNEIRSGEDFAFPAETNTSTSWLNLDQTAGTDEFTLIYSTSLLPEPAFLNQPAGHELTQDEQRQLETLRQQNKTNSAAAEVVRTGAKPFVSVKVPQNAEGSPVIFMVRLEHK